jgi:hypothetical protein
MIQYGSLRDASPDFPKSTGWGAPLIWILGKDEELKVVEYSISSVLRSNVS